MMEQLFTSGDRAQDVLDWIENIECLGGVIEMLAECSDPMALDWHGGRIGKIIGDYSRAAKLTLDVSYFSIRQALGKHHSPSLAKIDIDFKRIKEGCPPVPRKEERINEVLEEIQEIKKQFSFIFDIEQELQEMQASPSDEEPVQKMPRTGP